MTTRVDHSRPSSSAWSGRRVLVTGHTGFKGSWLSWWLTELGAEVSGLALAPTGYLSMFEVTGLADVVRSMEGDIEDRDMVAKVLDEARPEVVFHLAAQPLVRPSYQDPVATFATNVVGLANVLDLCRSTPTVRAVVNVTSDKCYENRESAQGHSETAPSHSETAPSHSETDPMGGHDPYSASKGCAELVTASMRRSFYQSPDGPRLASARAGNVVGGGDWALDRLVPDMVRAFGSGEPVVIRRPEAVRPWQHVLEPLSGYLLLAERLMEAPGFDQGWNFGPAHEDARSVRWVVEQVADRWGSGADYRVEPDGPYEATTLTLDCSKASSELDWSPRLRLSDALDWTVDWYRAHLDGADMAELTRHQIDDYQRLGRR